jgi:predicted nucleic acid-binding protein
MATTATTGGNRVFVDTNILVYAQSIFDPRQAAAASKVAELIQAGDELWISTQVMREYLSVMSRPVLSRPAIPMLAILADLSRFESHFQVAEDSKSVFSNLKLLLQSISVGGRQIHDANIVAKMQAYGITH